MDGDSFVLGNESQNTVIDLLKIEYLFDFSNLDKNQELFIKKWKSCRQIEKRNSYKHLDR